MPSDLEIVNGALTRLGQPPISVIGEATRAGALAAAEYERIRDGLLRSHPWNFATTTAQLTAHLPTPVGWLKAWELPLDQLRVLSIVDIGGPETEVWSIEDGVLVEKVAFSSVVIRYIRRVLEPGRFSHGFVDALIATLAQEWVEPLTSSASLSQRIDVAQDRALQVARSAEGQEGSVKVIQHSSWIQRR